VGYNHLQMALLMRWLTRLVLALWTWWISAAGAPFLGAACGGLQNLKFTGLTQNLGQL
jgi:hypothetical protein